MINPTQINLSAHVSTWHGPSDTPATRLPSDCSWLPSPLKEWHELASQWSTPVITTKEMITPGQIEPRNDMAIFMEDYGDQLWAFDVDDPTIVLESQPDGSWERCAENLSEFLTHNALHESAHTAPFWRASSNVPDSKLPEILTKMQQVSFNGWLWPRPGHQIFLGEGIIADIGPAMKNQSPWENHRGYTEVQIGATNSELLDHLDEMRDIKWLRPLFG